MIDFAVNILYLIEFLIVAFAIIYGFYWINFRSPNELNERMGFEKMPNGSKKQQPLTERIQHSLMPNVNLESLPTLKPLNCVSCGAGVIIRETHLFCPNCKATDNLPTEHLQLIKTKLRAAKTISMYRRNWRLLYFFTTRYATYLLLIACLLQIVTPFFFIDELTGIRDLDDFLLIFQIIGIINFVFLFLILTPAASEIKKKNFVKPINRQFTSTEKISNCSSCGGGIEYVGNDFAVGCIYCNVQNFRYKFSAESRQANEQQIGDFERSLKTVSHNLKASFSLILGTFWVFGGLGFLITGFMLIIGGTSMYFDGGPTPLLGVLYGIIGLIIFVFSLRFLRDATRYVF
jgi:predicted RNA-binding Zn-ribbon protein involved in translation (DUF1610 family)